MNDKSYLTYQTQYESYLRDGDYAESKRAVRAMLTAYELPEGMSMTDRQIPGHPVGRETLTLRVFRPAGDGPFPVVLDIHGGGWVGGNLDIDNRRCIEIAKRIPAVLVSVDYTLSDHQEHHYPAPLMDCVQAWLWLSEHAKEIGGDPDRMGIHGSSAGGNLAAGLSLYIRDHRGPQCQLTVLNCPCLYLDFPETYGYQQNYRLRMGPDEYAMGSEFAYLGGRNGDMPSYYAFPGHCPDLRGLNPHYLIAGEYDTLRDDAVRYMQRLLRVGVRTDFQLAACACHCFTGVPNPYTDLTHDMIAFAFRREFGMLGNR